MKKPFYEILKNAFNLYVNRFRYAYFYGAKGEILTDKRMTELIKAYPNYYERFSEQALEEIKRYSRGKIGLDCSGFLSMISGVSGNSASLFKKTENKTTPANGKAGYLLYKKGHCGVDIGYGYCMHIGTSGNTIEIAKIKSVGWTDSGAFPGYDYSEAKNF